MVGDGCTQSITSHAAFVHATINIFWALQKCYTAFQHLSHGKHTLWLQAYKMEWWSNMFCVVLGHVYIRSPCHSNFLHMSWHPTSTIFPLQFCWLGVCLQHTVSGKVTCGVGAIPAGMLMP